MANVLFCYPNLADDGTLSGGSWKSSQPLTNLQDDRLAKKARSTNDDAASTLVNVDLGADRYVRAVGIISHNLSLSATIRVRLGNDSGFSSQNYDSGTINFDDYSLIYPPGVLITGDPAESDDKLTQAEYDLGYPLDYFDFFNSNGRYMRIEVVDTSNSDNYVEFGRLWIGWGWRPTLNAETGLGIGWETTSTSTETDGGVTFHNERSRRRVVSLSLVNATEDEALVRAFEMNRRQGGGDPILFCYDSDDTFHIARRTFLATLRSLSPLSVPHDNFASASFKIVEEL